jgi:hypothetical protein
MKNKYLIVFALLVSGLQFVAGDETSVSNVQEACASLAAPESSDISFAAVSQLVQESGREAAAYISLAVQQIKAKIESGWSWLTSKISSGDGTSSNDAPAVDPTTGSEDDMRDGVTTSSTGPLKRSPRVSENLDTLGLPDDSTADVVVDLDDSSGESAGTEQE